MSTAMIGFYTILRREVIRFFRIWPQSLLPSPITMGLYMMIFGQLIGARVGDMSGVNYLYFILPGLLMIAVVNNSFMNVVSSFFIAKFQRCIEEMYVAPLSPIVILLGYVLAGVLRGLTVAVLVLMTARFFIPLPCHNIILTLFVLSLTSLLFSLLGLLNAVYAKSWDDINLIPTFILTPLTYLGGVFFSLELLSPTWKAIALFNPVYYMVNALRIGMLGVEESRLAISISVIIGLNVLVFLITYRALEKGTGVRT